MAVRRPPAWLSASVAAASMVAIGFAVGVAYERAQQPEPPANPLASAGSEAGVVEACRESIQRVPHEGVALRVSPTYHAELKAPEDGVQHVDVRGVVSYDVAPLPNVAATVEASRTYVCDVWSESDGETWRASVELSEAVYGGK